VHELSQTNLASGLTSFQELEFERRSVSHSTTGFTGGGGEITPPTRFQGKHGPLLGQKLIPAIGRSLDSAEGNPHGTVRTGIVPGRATKVARALPSRAATAFRSVADGGIRRRTLDPSTGPSKSNTAERRRRLRWARTARSCLRRRRTPGDSANSRTRISRANPVLATRRRSRRNAKLMSSPGGRRRS